MGSEMCIRDRDINLPNFIYDSENRINKLNELCIVMPMNIDLRNEIIKENDLYKKYEILNSYTKNINEN